MDGERIDTGGRVEEMGKAFAQKYGTSYALKDEVSEEALYVLLADDRTRERIKDHSGFRVRVRGTRLPEEAGDDMTRVNVEEIEQSRHHEPREKVDPNLTPTRTHSRRVRLFQLTIRFGAKAGKTR